MLKTAKSLVKTSKLHFLINSERKTGVDVLSPCSNVYRSEAEQIGRQLTHRRLIPLIDCHPRIWSTNKETSSTHTRKAINGW